MSSKKINQELLKLEPSVILSFYRLDILNEGPLFFHSGENGFEKSLIFQGQEYQYIPIKAEGFELNADGRLPRPKLTISNVNGQMSPVSLAFNDFIGSRLTRTKTFIKFLDAENFPDNINPHGDPDPDATLPKDEYIVNIKTVENNQLIEYELRSTLDLEKAILPGRRIMPNHCCWLYRSIEGCKYSGPPVADVHDTKFTEGYLGSKILLDKGFWNRDSFYNKGDWVRMPTADGNFNLKPLTVFVCIHNGIRSNPLKDKKNWVEDQCSKGLTGCRLRYGPNTEDFREQYEPVENSTNELSINKGLPYGGTPGVDRYKF